MHRNSDSTEAETAHPNRFSGALVSRDETLGWEELRDPTLLLGASPRLHSRTNAAYALLIPRCIQLRAQRETARTAVTESADRRHSHRPPNMIRQTLTALLVLAVPAIAQAEASAKKNTVDKTVVELAVQNGKFNTLVAAVKAAGLGTRCRARARSRSSRRRTKPSPSCRRRRSSRFSSRRTSRSSSPSSPTTSLPRRCRQVTS